MLLFCRDRYSLPERLIPLLFILSFLYATNGYSKSDSTKSCHFILKGYVLDALTQKPLAGTILYLPALQKGVLTNAKGFYRLENICRGELQLEIIFLGYKKINFSLHASETTQLDFMLQPDTGLLESVVISGKQDRYFSSIQPISAIEGKDLDRTRGLTLGESLKQIPGVHSVQTGPSISKPVIQGLHSNRILILNNGIRQEGQQWGSEHAPEIDPFIATKLTVVKGPGSIRYGSDAIGGVVLVEPRSMRTQPGIDGEINLAGMSNGRMGVTSGMLQGAAGKKLAGLSWRIQGTERKAGNFRTARYFMENTGLWESNYSGTLAYNRKKFGGEVYYSAFNTTLGIFTGSVAESVSDMMAAIQRPEPITPSYFNYMVGRPYQTVFHELFKSSAWLKSARTGRFDVVFARQQNERSEYDYIPLNGSLNPELYLRIVSQTVDATWQHKPIRNITGTIGFNGITQGNVREFQFLIPNFRNYGGGIFVTEKWTGRRLTLEAGARYDYRWLRVYTLDPNTAKVITPTYDFSNTTGSFGAGYQIAKYWSVLVHVGTAWKAPTVNELFSNGVHQSAASYEIGNPNLVKEQAYQFNASVNYSDEKLSVEAGIYNNYIHHYTFLKPDLQYIYTIRGAFPSFTYTQVNAVFRGLDATVKYKFTHALSVTSKSSLLQAYNYTIDNYLVLTPANRYDLSARYGFGRLFKKLTESFLSVNVLYVAHQSRVPPNSDYAPPPPAYFLLGMDAGFDIPSGNRSISILLGVTNLLNVAYRDYLNRFRYYTDDLGRNFSVRVKVPFEVLKKEKGR